MIRYFPELIPIFPWKSGPFLPSEGIFSWIQTQKTPAGLGSIPGRCSVHSHSCSLSFPMQALKSSGNSPPGNPQGVLEFFGLGLWNFSSSSCSSPTLPGWVWELWEFHRISPQGDFPENPAGNSHEGIPISLDLTPKPSQLCAPVKPHL